MINPGKQKNSPPGLRGVPLCRTQIKQDSCHYLAAGRKIYFFSVIAIDYGLPFPGMSKKHKRLWVLRLPGFDSFFSHGCSEKMRNSTISSDLFLPLINPHDDTLRHEKCRANIGGC